VERHQIGAKAESGDDEIRRPWIPPAVHDLPKLTDLTLQTGSPIVGGGGTGGGGSSVF
jgi:hypothetical protein